MKFEIGKKYLTNDGVLVYLQEIRDNGVLCFYRCDSDSYCCITDVHGRNLLNYKEYDIIQSLSDFMKKAFPDRAYVLFNGEVYDSFKDLEENQAQVGDCFEHTRNGNLYQVIEVKGKKLLINTYSMNVFCKTSLFGDYAEDFQNLSQDS